MKVNVFMVSKTTTEVKDKCWICGRTREKIIEELNIDAIIGENIEDIDLRYVSKNLMYDKNGIKTTYGDGRFYHLNAENVPGGTDRYLEVKPEDVIEMQIGIYVCSICRNAIEKLSR